MSPANLQHWYERVKRDLIESGIAIVEGNTSVFQIRQIQRTVRQPLSVSHSTFAGDPIIELRFARDPYESEPDNPSAA